MEEIEVLVADPSHEKYVDTILQTIADAAKVRGTGIAKRTHEYLATKMKEAKAVILSVATDSPDSVISRRGATSSMSLRQDSSFILTSVALEWQRRSRT